MFDYFDLIYISSRFVKNHRKMLLQGMTQSEHVTIHLVAMDILALNLVEKLMTHHSVPRQNGNGIPGLLPDDSTVQTDS